jgi:DNA-binding NtrC family response regulator
MDSAAGLQLEGATHFVVRSPVMQRLIGMVERVAGHMAAVLIVGETGTGKELVARAVHEHSPRSGKPFVDVNCAALPEHLVESELFGYEKGAFSGADRTKPGLFEVADQGTIFLDEIGELDIKVQAKLLRILDGVSYFRLGGSRKVEVNVRVIAATNRNPEEEVRVGKFRQDLYHRLSHFQLQVPPLRERPEDVSALAEHFLQQHCPAVRFTDDSLSALHHYGWPGNVRELKNAIFKAAMNVRPGAGEIRVHDLPAEICGLPDRAGSGQLLEGNLDEMERRMIFQALEQAAGSQTRAAKQLGISSRTLRRKLEKYRVRDQQERWGTPLGMLNGQQQRYYRVNIEIPVLIKDVDGEELQATSVNVSSGGIAIKSPVTLKHGSTQEITFNLPGAASSFETKAKLAWASPGGLAGLSFLALHPALHRELQGWLLARAKEEGWATVEPASELQT